MKNLTQEELKEILDRDHWAAINRWLARGDGVAVYENRALDSADAGYRQFVSYGSARAQIDTKEAPQRLPDIGNAINWAYQLVGVYQGEPL